jgi:hypothetical protein
VAAVLRAVEEVVHANPDDIPFAAVYLRDTRGTLALAASTGLEARGAAPATVDSLTLAQMRAGAELWPFVPGPAMILSVATGQDGDAGVLIAGVSSRRALDDEYRAFLELVAPLWVTRGHTSRSAAALNRWQNSIAPKRRFSAT